MIRKTKLSQLLILALLLVLSTSMCSQKGTFKDKRDGKTYKTLNIYGKTWMTENLNTTHYRDGTPIQEVKGNANWDTLKATDAAYCWYNDDSATYAGTYGAIYTWAVVNTKKLCPTGWHVPTDAEWTTLTNYLGGTSVAGGKLKETGTTHWKSPNTGATNETGFTALPGGMRAINGACIYVGEDGRWWSATEASANYAWIRSMSYVDSNVTGGNRSKFSGFSVRCLKD
jgi:uncharacterized protein (TIGR02145 family)